MIDDVPLVLAKLINETHKYVNDDEYIVADATLEEVQSIITDYRELLLGQDEKIDVKANDKYRITEDTMSFIRNTEEFTPTFGFIKSGDGVSVIAGGANTQTDALVYAYNRFAHDSGVSSVVVTDAADMEDYKDRDMIFVRTITDDNKEKLNILPENAIPQMICDGLDPTLFIFDNFTAARKYFFEGSNVHEVEQALEDKLDGYNLRALRKNADKNEDKIFKVL